PALEKIGTLRMSSSPIAFCVSPTFQTSRLTDSAGMKRYFGARPLESFTHWKYWIAASPKREGVLLGSELSLMSNANDGAPDLTRFNCGSHRTSYEVEACR